MIYPWSLDALIVGILLFLLIAVLLVARQSVGRSEDEPEFEAEAPQGGLYPRRLIRQSGLIPDKIAFPYWAAKLLGGLLLVLIFLEFRAVEISLWWGAALALLGFFAIDLWLLARRRERRARIERSLSYFVDLIASFLGAGMHLSAAFRHAGRYGFPRRHPLAGEISLVGRELEAGRDRGEALLALAERTGVKDLKSLATLLNVGFRVGASIRVTLEEQADLLRAKQQEGSMKLLNRKTLESLFPLLLVSLPIFGVLVGFPVVVELSKFFRLFSGYYG